MFIGHFAVGFAAKRFAPQASLGALIAAPILLDLLWPIFLLAGIERVRVDPGNTLMSPFAFDHYPWSHSLVMAVVWGGLFGIIYAWRTGYRREAVVIALAVVSHWFLDVATHRPDLPLWPGGSIKVGLGLWDHPVWTIATEGILFRAGVGLYLGATKGSRPELANNMPLIAFVLTLLAVYVLIIFAPPPSPNISQTVIALFGLPAFLVIPWASWAERRRTPPAPPS